MLLFRSSLFRDNLKNVLLFISLILFLLIFKFIKFFMFLNILLVRVDNMFDDKLSFCRLNCIVFKLVVCKIDSLLLWRFNFFKLISLFRLNDCNVWILFLVNDNSFRFFRCVKVLLWMYLIRLFDRFKICSFVVLENNKDGILFKWLLWR